MIIAIANRQGCISPVFDVSDGLCVVEIVGGTVVHRETVPLKCRDPFRRAKEVAGTGVEILICGAVSRAFETALIGVGVRVLPFICGDLETVIGAFLQGRLTDSRFLMPGCFGRRQGRRLQHRRGKGLKGR